MSTVGDELRRLLPGGTNPDREEDSAPDWGQAPYLPTDVFAAAAHLLEASGAYQFIVAPFAAAGDGRSSLRLRRPHLLPG